MVAVIHTSKSIRAVLNYNEQKLQQRQAEGVSAFNYPKEMDDLNYNQKLFLLQRQAELNIRAKVNCVHISLNFDIGEELPKEKMIVIAQTYLDKIGFAEQPALVYSHHDAGHPHMHLVTTNIKQDGSRINLHNLGRNQSEKARKEIEITFDLVRAESKKQKQQTLRPVVLPLNYGHMETKAAIAKVLQLVLGEYKFGSIAELNAILEQYNISAERGSENSRTYLKNGLNYRVLDAQGKCIGVPIKASSFSQKPTLKYLEKCIEKNIIERIAFKGRIKNVIDLGLLSTPNQSLQQLIQRLKKEGIATLIRTNEAGINYGITFIDHRTKCVFNGSSLGKNYSIKTLQERCGIQPKHSKVVSHTHNRSIQDLVRNEDFTNYKSDPFSNSSVQNEVEGDMLLDPIKSSDDLPYTLRGKRKKQKQRKIGQQQ